MACLFTHNDVALERGRDLIKQRGTVDRLRPRLGIRKRDRAALHAVVVAAKTRPLGLHQLIEDRRAQAKRFGRGLAFLLVLDRRQLREPRDLDGDLRFFLLVPATGSSPGAHSGAALTAAKSFAPTASCLSQSLTSWPSVRSGNRSTTLTEAATS